MYKIGFSPKFHKSMLLCFIFILSLTSSSFINSTQAGSFGYDGILPASSLFIFIDDLIIPESIGTANFTVRLSKPADSDVTIFYTTADGTAVGGQDYTIKSGSISIPISQTIGTISVHIVNDNTSEGNETFYVNLTAANNAIITDPQGNGTILDDDINNQLWAKSYDTPGQTDFGGKYIAIDASSNVYVAGNTYKPGIGITGNKFTLLKYDTNGTLKWFVTKSGDTRDLDLDSNGNIYLCGLRNEPNEAFLQKYDPKGILLWEKTYKGPLGKMTGILDMVIDKSGNVYVTGETMANKESGKTYTDYFTQKYTSSGSLLWTKLYGGSINRNDGAQAIVVDTEMNIYVSGYVQIDLYNSFSIYTLKYNPNGTLLWEQPYQYSGHTEHMVHDMVLDHAGNLYLAGTSYPTSYPTPLILKYTTNGTFLWARDTVGSSGGSGVPYEIAVDQFSHLFIAAAMNNHFTFVKVTPDGIPEWGYFINGDTSGGCYDVAVDGSGNSYTTGIVEIESVGYAAVTFNFNPDGKYLWNAYYNGKAYNEGNAIALDSNMNAYITGRSSFYTSGEEMITVKYGAFIYPSTIMISDSMAFETPTITGTSEMRFTVTLSKPINLEVTMSYSTVDGTALQGVDYVQSSGTITIPAGETTGSFYITILGDDIVDGGKFFFVNLYNLVNAFFTDSQAMGTINELGPYVQFLPMLNKP